MRCLFTDEALLQRWLDVEAALAQAEARVRLIPAAAAEEITRKAKASNLDIPGIGREIESTSHPIVPVIRALQHVCNGDTGQYIHWGATTQDITDTATVLQIKDAFHLIKRDLFALEDGLLDLAKRHRNTLMAGRTHGQYALPITFGFKVAIWASEVRRHLERLDGCRTRVLIGQFAGAVGTLASVSKDGMEIQRLMLADLDLHVPTISWHTARDGIAEFITILGMISATMGKIAEEIVTLQRTEVAEVEEPFIMGKVGSSTMPHKRNPMICEAVVGVAKLIRQQVPVAIEAMGHAHERDWALIQMEWAFVPETCLFTAGALAQTVRVICGLIVYPERMESNVGLLRGLILSEAVMLQLARKTGRQDAHDIVYKASMAAHDQQLSLKEALLAEPDVASRMTPEEMDALLDPWAYVGLSGEFVDRVVAEAQQARG
jgi:3-carboxy-cis,cis-muconate cycloisomerase